MKRVPFCAAVTVAVCLVSQSAGAQTVQQAIDCYQGLAGQKQLAPLASKLMLSGEPKATLVMQADESKPTPKEKEALQAWAPMRDACFEVGVKWLDASNAPPWLRSITLQTKDSADALVSMLYRGELTFGQFNVRQMALSADMRKRLDSAAETARREQSASPNPSQSAPPPAAAPAPAAVAINPVQDRYQCELDAARAYPPMMVQRMTSPGFQAAPQPTQTDCTMVGTQMTCRNRRAGADTSIYNRPPTYVTEDANEQSRASTFRGCMAAKGYRAN